MNDEESSDEAGTGERSPDVTGPSGGPAGSAASAVGPDGATLEARVAEFVAAVSEGDEHTALRVVNGALEAGTEPEDVLLRIIAPAQYRVGEDWAADRISVATEHVATGISDRAVAAVAATHSAPRAWYRGRIAVACVEGEWHALPARILAEVLRLRGWRVDFLGAHVPGTHLIDHLHRTGAHLVALSCSLPVRLPAAYVAVSASQEAGVPVLAGGAGFGPDGEYARTLGVDMWAPDAVTAASLVHDEWPVLGGTRVPDLAHLEDQEYALLMRDRHRLVADTLAALPARFPAMKSYTSHQMRCTEDDLSCIAEFLAAALYVDDQTLFTRFLLWTADILEARNVPVVSLLEALDLMSLSFRDFFRAGAVVGAGLTALREREGERGG
ncbi:cobalamin-dependent protein, partial [Streptomyces daliensis]|nr:cobalamin-dependent protein [Streptomyces daliensis]